MNINPQHLVQRAIQFLKNRFVVARTTGPQPLGWTGHTDCASWLSLLAALQRVSLSSQGVVPHGHHHFFNGARHNVCIFHFKRLWPL